MKKIAIFTNDLHVGGIQKSVVNLLNNLDKKKYDIDLYLFDKELFYEVPNGVNVIYREKFPFFCKLIPFKILRKFMKIDVLNKAYDVAIDFDSYQMYTAIGALSVNSKKKIIWVHNDIKIKLHEEFKYKVLYFFFKKKYQYFDTYCAVSQGALDSFKEIHHLENKEFKVIPNFIDTNDIKKKLDENCELIVDDKKVNIVTVGRLCHQKGIDIMLKNIKTLQEYRKDFHLYIIGDGPDKEKLLKLCEDLRLNNYVSFLGNQKNPYKYMKKMDLFYLASRYEGQGMVICEALSVGLDVVIPKHLEKYCPLVEGTSDVVNYMKSYKKRKNKKFNNLEKYNSSILKSLDSILQ